jgi:carboxyl-terminal processing protease
MKNFRTLGFTLAAAVLLSLPAMAAPTEPDPGQVEISVGRLLEQGHYSRKKLNDDVSSRLLKNYLETLDYNHLFFTQEDVDLFTEKYATSLDDDILLGNPGPAFAIFDVYEERVKDRVAKVKELVKEPMEFDSDRTVVLNRQKADWPKNEAEADQIWRDRITAELLGVKLNKHAVDSGAKTVTRRFNQVLRYAEEQTREDVIKTFLSALSRTYDPHSEYMSRSDLENFSINMRLSLVGIGAVLQSEDGYAKIIELVPGGPAQTDGRLKVSDRISAVAQGDEEFVDTVDMKLDKVVEKIRGKKGTTVRLQVIPATAADPSERKIIDLVRDEIKLKDQEAKAEIIEKSNGTEIPAKLGWITLPSFYADMDHSGAAKSKSTTRDVRALIERLKKEGIQGLVLDLRRNGGGSLEEAVNLTGLFIPKGPVVQAKDSNGNIVVSRDRNSDVAWDGPLVVLTNRLSASASEIVAAALQDYGRAVLVGDGSTFGKGTVQTMLEIGRFIPFLGGDSDQAGALKLTIQKFYRIAGGSTQLRGVESDITLPSPYDLPDIGESALKDPLPYDTVDAVRFQKSEEHPLFLDDLRRRSAARVAADPEFAYVLADLQRVSDKIAANEVSLNEETRRAEMEKDRLRKEKRAAEREKRTKPEDPVYEITLENIDVEELQPASHDVQERNASVVSEGDDALEEEDEQLVDAVRMETLRILSDLVELSRSPRTAAVEP